MFLKGQINLFDLNCDDKFLQCLATIDIKGGITSLRKDAHIH